MKNNLANLPMLPSLNRRTHRSSKPNPLRIRLLSKQKPLLWKHNPKKLHRSLSKLTRSPNSLRPIRRKPKHLWWLTKLRQNKLSNRLLRMKLLRQSSSNPLWKPRPKFRLSNRQKWHRLKWKHRQSKPRLTQRLLKSKLLSKPRSRPQWRKLPQNSRPNRLRLPRHLLWTRRALTRPSTLRQLKLLRRKLLLMRLQSTLRWKHRQQTRSLKFRSKHLRRLLMNPLLNNLPLKTLWSTSNLLLLKFRRHPTLLKLLLQLKKLPLWRMMQAAKIRRP
jgi:hypothetical protein